MKSTTGRHGSFSWPRSEFQLALAQRYRYVLFRVYEAHTMNAGMVELRDPIGRFQAGTLQLNLDSLVGDVGGLPT